MKESKVFHETYASYLQDLQNINIAERAELLGAAPVSDGAMVRFYSEEYHLSEKGVVKENGEEATFAVKVVLCKYFLMARELQQTTPYDWVTFRDFKDSSPLLSYFANNTNKTIESCFSGRIEELRKQTLSYGGVLQSSESHDLSVRFDALPKIPLLMNFNDRDDLFPAACSILFQKDADTFLDMECLAIAATYLTGKLIAGYKV